jgi:NAD(P)-dependent dehydrogenase (short-subunit alcohol dehydrogenase family)
MMDLTEQDWQRVLDVNVKGTFFVIQRVAKKMIDRGKGGVIVIIASIAGEKGRPLFLAYSASKAALLNMNRSVALALAQHQIRVNAVSPGTMDTLMWKDISEKVIALTDSDPGSFHEEWLEKIPLGRLADPADVTSMVLHLCSEESRYITGQAINICGGLSVL